MGLAAVAFVIGFTFGFRRPAGYCNMSTEQRRRMVNRASSGAINGTIYAGIVAVISLVVSATV